jgi:3-oxoacyl-[acyl-carrier protein] reductase
MHECQSSIGQFGKPWPSDVPGFCNRQQTVNRNGGLCRKEYGRLDVLVNNSGITKPVPHHDLEGMEDEWIDKIMQVNFRGAFACIRAFTPLLKCGQNPVVINISSIAARTV